MARLRQKWATMADKFRTHLKKFSAPDNEGTSNASVV